MTVDNQESKEQLRKRLIQGVVLTAITVAATILVNRKHWNEYDTVGLIVGVAMMVVVLIYAASLKARSKKR